MAIPATAVAHAKLLIILLSAGVTFQLLDEDEHPQLDQSDDYVSAGCRPVRRTIEGGFSG